MITARTVAMLVLITASTVEVTGKAGVTPGAPRAGAATVDDLMSVPASQLRQRRGERFQAKLFTNVRVSRHHRQALRRTKQFADDLSDGRGRDFFKYYAVMLVLNYFAAKA